MLKTISKLEPNEEQFLSDDIVFGLIAGRYRCGCDGIVIPAQSILLFCCVIIIIMYDTGYIRIQINLNFETFSCTQMFLLARLFRPCTLYHIAGNIQCRIMIVFLKYTMYIIYTKSSYLFIIYMIKLFLLLLCYYQGEKKITKQKTSFFTKVNNK